MKIEEIKRKSNPYSPLTHRINKQDFIGRDENIKKLRTVLDEYQRTLKLKNILISGERSVGKSTLMNRFRNILEDYNFAIYEVEIPRNSDIPIDEFDFFKELIGDLFARYSPNFFDPEQAEIWYSLTRGEYKHDSTFINRKLNFPTQYSNKVKGIRETLNYKDIEQDFIKILDELVLKETQFKGFAILIDEFQELSRNVVLLDTLRKLSENLDGLMIIGAGLPTFLNNNAFEKYLRLCLPMTLKNMNHKESLDLIISPLEKGAKINRYEAEQCFDEHTIYEILERTGGNPLHIKLLCYNLFEYFAKKNDVERMQLNREVMDAVMEYYCNISSESRLIRNSLETASRDQLEIFARLYNYEGFTLKASILCEIAFNSIQGDIVTKTKDQIINDFIEIYDLGLFRLHDKSIKIEKLANYSFDELSQISYMFIGDRIDKLYASYYYEYATDNPLNTNENNDFETLLAMKLATELEKATIRKKIPEVLSEEELLHFHSISSENLESSQELFTRIENLEKIDADKDISEENRKMINEIAEKFNLSRPAIYLSMFSFEGYYLLITNISIRGKKKTIYTYYPVKNDIAEAKKIKEKIEDYSQYIDAALDEYTIKINWMYLYFIQKKPFLLIYFVDFSEEQKKLFDAVRERDFQKSINIVRHLFNINLRIDKKGMATDIELYNNYGFCLINVGDIEAAKEIFLNLQERLLLSKVNLSFIYYIENHIQEAKLLLKGILRKDLSASHDAQFLHLFLKHPKLKKEDIIVEDIPIINIVSWNLALLLAQDEADPTTLVKYLKSVKVSTHHEYLLHRVKSWIKFYSNELDDAIEEIKCSMSKCQNERLRKSLENDFAIFKECSKN